MQKAGLETSVDTNIVRDIFDQYQQPENRLTHALATVLDQERSLLKKFLRENGVTDVPNPRSLTVSEQQVRGVVLDDTEVDTEEVIRRGLPDAAIYDDEGWAVLLECKIQANVDFAQLERHRATAKRHGFETAWIVV